MECKFLLDAFTYVLTVSFRDISNGWSHCTSDIQNKFTASQPYVE